MPANYCYINNDSDDASESSFGMGQNAEARDDAHFFDEGIKANERIRNKNARRGKQANSVVNDVNGKNYSGQQATKADTQKARKYSKEFIKRMKEIHEKEGAPRINEILKEARAMVAGTNVGKTTYFQNLKNKLYAFFVDSRGAMLAWLGEYAGVKGVERYKQPLIQMFTAMNAKARSANTLFRRRQETLLDSLTDAANRAGMAKDEMAMLLGHYATARHAPEANAYLIERWRNKAAELRAKPDSKKNRARIRKLERKADNLERHLDDMMDSYDERKEGRFFSSGYTNAQARARMDEVLKKTGMSKAEADAFADKLSEEFNFIVQERVRNGTLTMDLVNLFPDFRYYVPMMSRNSSWFNNNFRGSPSDATPYNPGSYHAMEGRNNPPDSAWATLGMYGSRAAMEIGSRDFGIALYSLARLLDNRNIKDSGLRVIDYEKFLEMSSSKNADVRDAKAFLLDNGGLVANVPIMQANGTYRMKKKFLYFAGGDWNHEGTWFSARMLNKALSADFKLADVGPIVSGLARTTSSMGQLTTRFTMLFSPVSGSRDFGERLFNLFNRSYETVDGQQLHGSDLAFTFIANAAQAGRILYKGMRGQLEAGSKAEMLYREFQNEGLEQKFTQRMQVSDKNFAELVAERAESKGKLFDAIADPARQAEAMHRLGLDSPVLKRVTNTMGTRKHQFMHVVDGWNDYFQNIAAFTHYLTLREANVGRSQASRAVLQEMNMSQRGTVAPWLQALAPFVTPTVQSGTALMRTLGFGAGSIKDIPKAGWKGYAALVGAFAAYSMLAPLARELMGTDENGRSRYDAMSLEELTRGLPIGLGDGNYIRFPIGFGLPQIASMISVGLNRVSEGRMEVHDLLFDVAFSIVKNTAPGSWPNYGITERPMSFMMSVLTPMPFRPVMEAATNTNFFGSDIWRDVQSDTKSLAESGSTGTPRRFHTFARFMRNVFGVDMQPEIYEHLERGYALGPLRLFTTLANKMDDIYRGAERPSALENVNPLLAAMGITSWYGRVPSASKSLYYEAKRHYDHMLRMQGVDIAVPKDLHRDQHEAWKRERLEEAGWSIEQIDDYLSIWRAEKALREQGRLFNEEYKDTWQNLESSDDLREAFGQLALDNEDIYNEVINDLNYYGGQA